MAELRQVLSAGYELWCSCDATWTISELDDTECPACGEQYDAETVAMAAEHASA